MSYYKRHFAISDTATACGRGKVTTTNVYNVDCLACRGKASYHDKWREAEAAKEAAFLAQTPVQVREPWKDGNIICSGTVARPDAAIPLAQCGGEFFRYQGRSCMGHYEDFVCAACGHVESRLTETGMSF